MQQRKNGISERTFHNLHPHLHTQREQGPDDHPEEGQNVQLSGKGPSLLGDSRALAFVDNPDDLDVEK